LEQLWYDRTNQGYFGFIAMAKKKEEERQMPYITSVEQIGYDRGKVEGKVEERKSIALNMLQRNLDLQTIAEITGLTIAQIQDLQGQVS
jgi:predicted transposase/invertase (TIGR01784 family)